MTIMFNPNDLRWEARNKLAETLTFDDIHKIEYKSVMNANVVMIRDSHGMIKIVKNRYGPNDIVLKAGDPFPRK